VHNILEGSFEVWLLKAQHSQAVPGRKPDVKDAQWIAELLSHGLVRPSCIPPRPQRDLRDLTRHRTNLVRERASLVNRLHKVLESANIKLAGVASDIMGLSARKMLAALVAGEEDVGILAELAHGKLREKRAQLEQALSGHVRLHHRFLLSELLAQIDGIEDTIRHCDAHIHQAQAADAEVVALLDTIPGIGPGTAEVLLAEIGLDMSRFPSAASRAAWAGLAPGNNESAGRQRNGRARKGNVWLRTALVQAAQAAAHTKGTSLSAQYHRIAARRGATKAVIAVAHTLLVIAYYVILRREPYQELGPDYADRQRPAVTATRLVRRLQQLGFQVSLSPLEPSHATPAASAALTP
jgi:transposase